MRPTYRVTELLGDGIGPELSRAVHTLADALPVRLDFLAVDFSLENRRARKSAVYDEAVEAITATIGHDGRVGIAEAELLRTICSTLHCPLPPMLGTAPGHAPVS